MEEDMMSQLPDAILQHILSFLDTKQTVQTSIFSTRFQNLWSSLSDLNFTLSRFAAHSRVNLKNRQTSQEFSTRFSHFVSHFLSHRDHASTIRNFHLSFDSRLVNADAAFLEQSVDYAVSHGVQSLHLDAHCRPSMRFPAAFFSCKTLRELKLKQFTYGIYIPKDFSLPHLHTLYLENSELIDDGEFYSLSKEPFSRLPELEKLSLRQCTMYGLIVLAPKLRVLEIMQDNKLLCEVMEEISTPRLTSFSYGGYFALECRKIKMPVLEDVCFNIYGLKNKSRPFKCIKMLQQFGNYANNVSLSLDTLKVLEMDRGLIEVSPSPFPNMKCLKLTKGRREIPTVLKTVMNYLREGSLWGESLMIEFPEGVCVVERNSEDSSDELQLQHLFGMEDEPHSQTLNFGALQTQDGRLIF